jgi:cyanobactin maturation PatA/PatG family protease
VRLHRFRCANALQKHTDSQESGKHTAHCSGDSLVDAARAVAGLGLPCVDLSGLDRLWAETTGDPAVCIAILDGPVDVSHDCFPEARLEILETLVPSQAGTGAASRHGTHVASVIFGRHGGPVAGIAPRCSGLIVPVFSDGPDGTVRTCSQLDMARAILQSIEAGAHIISISAGQLAAGGEAETYLAGAIRSCTENNVLIVAAAGNDGCDCIHVPAAVPSVLAVGAMDSSGVPLGSSNWGAAYLTQGVLAPGKDIVGAVPHTGGDTARASGTSYATPVAAGIAGLLLSLQRKNGGKPNPREVRDAILASAIPCDLGTEAECRRVLAGRIDIVGAMARLLQNGLREEPGASPAAGERRVVTGEPQFRLSAAAVPEIRSDERYHQLNSGEQHVQNQPIDALDIQPSGSASAVPGAMTLQPEALTPGIMPSSCGCGGKSSETKETAASGKPAMVYAIGIIGYDFGTEARRDSLVQMGLANPNDPRSLLDFLTAHPETASSIAWVLTQETTPVYAISPYGAFAAHGYEKLRSILHGQLTEGVEQVSIPGYLAGGSVTLMNGQTVPVISMEQRGVFSWNLPTLVSALASTSNSGAGDISNFLERVYYEQRNLGVTPQERALNFSASNAFTPNSVFQMAIEATMKLESIGVERSPNCRPGSDCWDVKMSFFDPTKRYERSRHVYRYTVDVSDVIPVTVGKIRHWDVF